jgi:beta-catenin-like protein 1
MELRELHPKDASKWIDSEVALDEAISSLSTISSNPKLYAIIVQQHAHETLVGLLAHDNADVSVAVLNLLAELLDDAPEEDEELMVQALGGELAEAGAVSAALLNWRRVQEAGEGLYVYVYVYLF